MMVVSVNIIARIAPFSSSTLFLFPSLTPSIHVCVIYFHHPLCHLVSTRVTSTQASLNGLSYVGVARPLLWKHIRHTCVALHLQPYSHGSQFLCYRLHRTHRFIYFSWSPRVATMTTTIICANSSFARSTGWPASGKSNKKDKQSISSGRSSLTTTCYVLT